MKYQKPPSKFVLSLQQKIEAFPPFNGDYDDLY